ncbi:hypothetical protein BX600DRAFT_451504 [Xylariales sp. PMI_506]|nr:hypothetical protein BX600DRAFT_451504 [Xylariales sp. PMI_506]
MSYRILFTTRVSSRTASAILSFWHLFLGVTASGKLSPIYKLTPWHLFLPAQNRDIAIPYHFSRYLHMREDYGLHVFFLLYNRPSI